MRRLVTAVTASLALMTLGTACDGGEERASRARQQLAELQKKKKAEAQAQDEKLAPLVKVEEIQLDPPYDDEGSVRITPDGPCPEGFWALFSGEAPGANAEEKKVNEANRKTLAEGLKSKRYLVKLRVGNGVTLKPFDAPSGVFPIEVLGTVDCTDSRGRVAIAWSEAVAKTQGGGALSQWYWAAPVVNFSLPMGTQLEAKAFEQANKIAVSARVVFTIAKTETDKRITKVEKVTKKVGDEVIEYGGGAEDWGAGRLVRAQLLGVRVATEREKKQLLELRPTAK